MDIKWLEDFLSLVQTRNFSRSAQERSVTQSALSRRIQALEAWVGADLVDRSTYPLALTPAGKLFSASASEAMRLLNDTRAMLRGQETDDHILRVSAGHALSLNFFPDWLGSVQSWYGPLRARILPTNVHDSVLSLVEGNCDLLLCYHHAELPVELDAKRFEYLVLGVETVMPVTVPNRAGSPTFALPGSKARPIPHLTYTATSFFGRVVQRIQSRAAQPACLETCYESDLAELLKTMALAGRGLAWLPESCIASELGEGKLVRSGGEQWTMRLEIRLFRAINHRKPMLDKLWENFDNGKRSTDPVE
ncbi:LysR family transcriptional regulator [Massilia dura]|uniref:LysR family transcriptional regulator n=1 Tax=Pseudoduganella dura TaxID=321982 RepID=A0A6I3X5N3_9BURK|nr:LysR family transcriptional regulator [Pseudoduganella dura]MUI11517.1 LysR family transcriptional regulator [Pseudoduganella dura]GGX97191.1 LysR family transcriptional regulator [Pseudoduganella dura]